MCDEHLPDVLVFPPGTDLHDHPLYVSGHILLQDKVLEEIITVSRQFLAFCSRVIDRCTYCWVFLF